MSMPTLQTARLAIRPILSDDWQAVHNYMSNPAVTAYLPEATFTEADSQAFARQHAGDEAEAAAVIAEADGQLIGHIIFHPWFAPETYELGWVLHPDYHGQGYATEAARALLDYGFGTLGAHRIVATCQPQNPASYRVMEKLGMRREGHFQQCIHRGNGVWWDEFFYAMLREEWERR